MKNIPLEGAGMASTVAPSMIKKAKRKKRVWKALVGIIVVDVGLG
jgi:hypothetical protein